VNLVELTNCDMGCRVRMGDNRVQVAEPHSPSIPQCSGKHCPATSCHISHFSLCATQGSGQRIRPIRVESSKRILKFRIILCLHSLSPNSYLIVLTYVVNLYCVVILKGNSTEKDISFVKAEM
jgi:hypothetical protein